MDGIPSEIIKAPEGESQEELISICKDIYDIGIWPEDPGGGGGALDFHVNGGGGGAAGGRKLVTICLTKNVHMHTLSLYCTVAGARFRYPVPILMTARGPQDTLCYY